MGPFRVSGWVLGQEGLPKAEIGLESTTEVLKFPVELSIERPMCYPIYPRAFRPSPTAAFPLTSRLPIWKPASTPFLSSPGTATLRRCGRLPATRWSWGTTPASRCTAPSPGRPSMSPGTQRSFRARTGRVRSAFLQPFKMRKGQRPLDFVRLRPIDVKLLAEFDNGLADTKKFQILPVLPSIIVRSAERKVAKGARSLTWRSRT